MIYKIFGIVVVILSIANIVRSKLKKNRLEKRQDAAYELLKEEALDYVLKNGSDSAFRMDKKIMMHVKSKEISVDTVFDPQEKVVLGRSKDSTIAINSPVISSHHCQLELADGKVFLKDLGSSNGTVLKHGLKKIHMDSGSSVEVISGDKIIIGGICFEIELFYLQKSFFNKKKL